MSRVGPDGTLPLRRMDPAQDGASVGVGMDDGSTLPLRHIIGIGRNYAAHAEEQGAELPTHPLVFTKNPVACCLDGDDIVIPRVCQDREQVDYEGELAVILARAVRDIDEGEVLSPGGPVLGYAAANDVSARWWQKRGSGGQFNRGKSFDSFCPIGPAVTPAAAVGDPRAIAIRTTLNGETVQEATTAQMIFSVARLVAELARGTTLVPGTVILTGTPAGVGMACDPPRYLAGGDRVEVAIEGVGSISNTVRSDQ